jgi:uncharacterized protein YecT (DUF1311 family)
MLRLSVALITIITSVTLPPTGAQAKKAVACDRAMTTVELNACAEREFEVADAKLNAAYKKALAFIKLSGGDKPYDAASWEAALRTSQKAWLAYRDADCDGLMPMSWGGGTGTTSAVFGCRTTKTETRTQELIAITADN